MSTPEYHQQFLENKIQYLEGKLKTREQELIIVNDKLEALEELVEVLKEEALEYRGLCIRLWHVISDLNQIYLTHDNLENESDNN